MSCCQYTSATFRGGNLNLTTSGNTVDINLKYAEVRKVNNGFSLHSAKSGSTFIPDDNTLLGGDPLTYDIVMNYVAAAKYYSPDEFVGYEKLTVSNTVLSLDAAQYDDAIKAVLIVESGEIRWLGFAGVTLPTTSTGMLWTEDSGPLVLVTDLSKIRLIRNAATDATASIIYMR